MAKVKKKEALSLEDKLEQALVSVDEQPFDVPDNWCWVRLGCLGYTNIGLTYKPSSTCSDGTIVLRSSNIQNGRMDYDDIVMVDMDIPESKMSKKGDILICARNGSKSLVGKTAIVDRDGMSYGAFMAIFRSDFNPLIYYFLNSHYFRNLIDNDVNTTTINQVTQAILKELAFPLPPLSEQKRIVEQIESLFFKLDEVKDKTLEVLESYEIRRAAILHKALIGELTIDWRRKNKVDDLWEKIQLGDITDIKSSKRVYKDDYVEEGIPFFRSSEIVDLYDTGVTEPIYFITEEKYEEIKREKGVPEEGNLLVTSVGTIGKTWIVDDRKFYYKDGNLTEVVKCNKLDMKFLQMFIMSEEFKNQVVDTVSGSAYNALTIVKFKKIIINLPSIEEQEEIVRIVEALLKKEQKAKESIEQVLASVDMMKKSILAKAFRGELGTNNPDEESAVELLKQILSENI